MPSRFRTLTSSRIHTELSRGLDVWSLFNPVVFPTAINLGQGFMNWQPPAYILNELNSEFSSRVDLHHYSHPKGRPRLRQAISEHYSPSFRLDEEESVPSAPPKLRKEGGRKLDIETEIQVTSGANGGMYSIMAAFLEQGDEVVCFEPFFDQYEAEIIFNGGRPVYVPMIAPQPGAPRVVEADVWGFNWTKLEEKLSSPKAKILFLNTPHNPVGKVLTQDELSRIAALCIKYDILVVSDEVYDCLTFDGKPHLRIASLEGMWERTITVGSAGKSFACTGWRVGWLIGPAHLITPSRAVHTRITFAVNSASQEGVAIGLESASANDFFPTQIREYETRRALLRDALDDLGLPYTNPHGSYFIIADASDIKIPESFELPKEIKKKPKDYATAWFIAKTCDVVTIPVTAFYSEENAGLGDRLIRFSFCKDGQIHEAARRLQKVSNSYGKSGTALTGRES